MDRFRIISSAKIGEETCKYFNDHEQVIHIYIFCGYKPAGQALKQKWSKIKFYTVDVDQFLVKLKDQSRCDNRFSQLPTFMKITTVDNTHDNALINKSRYNLYGLFKNRTQAKNDFLKFARYFYSNNKSQIEDFQKDYPIQYNYAKSLNWYTKETFFYQLLNNFLRSSINPLQTSYLRLPFDATFGAIKYIYNQGKENKNMVVFRGGYINDKQLEQLQKNIGQYIEIFGFMSTSTSIDVAQYFIQNYNGNSLITVFIQDQARQYKIDYGYVNLINYSQFKQEQVLFNAQNVFKILSYKKEDGIHKISLKYGQLARIVKLRRQNLPQKQRNILINYRHQLEIITFYINNQGDVFNYCQMYDSELKYRQKYIKQNQGLQTIQFANELHKIGLLHDEKSDYNKALQYYQRSLKLKINILGENDINTTHTLHNMGNIYNYKEDYDKALQYYERALKIKMNLLGENNSKTANTLQNIGITYKYKNDSNKALNYYQRSLKININRLGEYHSSTAITLHNIGILYRDKSDHNKALQYYERSLKIKIKLLGENHSITAQTIHQIGIIYKIKTEYNKALQYFQRQLKININILGEYHSSTADTLQNIGEIYTCKENQIKALQYFQRSLKIKTIMLGNYNSSTASTLNNIGLLYYRQKKYELAKSYFMRCYKIRVEVQGVDHKQTIQTMQNIKKCDA